MYNIKYKILVLLLLVFTFLHAQKFEKEFIKNIAAGEGTIILNADYADIEIIEWNKNKVKLEAVMTAEGVPEEIAQSSFDKWHVDLKKEGDVVHVISKNNNRFLRMMDMDFDNMQFDMPELSLESLHVLDSFDFSFPELKMDSIFINNTVFYNASLDSINNFSFNLKSTELNAQNIARWQKENRQKIDALVKQSTAYARKQMMEERRIKMEMLRERIKLKKNAKVIRKEALRKAAIERRAINKNIIAKNEERRAKQEELRRLIKKQNEVKVAKREELKKEAVELRTKRRDEQLEKRKALRKKMKEQRTEIQKILANRKKAKTRTKLVLYVPKGTNFSLNIRYSKLRYSK